MTSSVSAQVPTAHASRYLQQLCKHWSHRFEVSFTPEVGTVKLPGADLSLAAAEEYLGVMLTVEDETQLARMEEVVAEHLDRFAFREAPLRFDWR